jgi:hypothetical protein
MKTLQTLQKKQRNILSRSFCSILNDGVIKLIFGSIECTEKHPYKNLQRHKMEYEYDRKRFDDVFNDNKGIIYRVNSSRAESMQIEFIEGLCYIQDYELASDDVINDFEAVYGFSSEIASNLCICGHHIEKKYYIRAKRGVAKGEIIVVGSDCIKKVSLSLFEDLTREKCLTCQKNLMDRRAKYQRDGYCDSICAIGMQPLHFGKYKGVLWRDVVAMNPSYISNFLINKTTFLKSYQLEYLKLAMTCARGAYPH